MAAITPRRFMSYDDTRDVPNIVVDGSPNEATVLTLTHWPGIAQPPGTKVDTSAEMAFAHLDEPIDHDPASAVTNNHYDQDGAVGLFALVHSDEALACRDLLIDLAAAGDFGTYRHRNAARTSMVLNAFADPTRSPIAAQLTGDSAADAGLLYETVLPLLADLVSDPLPHRDLWAAEDEELAASEEAVADGRVDIAERVDLDFALVTIDDAEPARTGHRFSHVHVGPVHPMAIHNATERSRLLLAHRSRFLYVDRYETWVQLRSRTPAPRVDLRPLAERLSTAENGATTWVADPPSALTPMLRHEGDSSLTVEAVTATIRRYLEAAPTAWDPFAPRT